MTDQEIRREYIRHVNKMIIIAMAIGSLVAFPVSILLIGKATPFIAWLIVVGVFGLLAAACIAAIHFGFSKNRPIFSRGQVNRPPSLSLSITFAVFFVGILQIRDIFRGNWQNCLIDLCIDLLLAISIGPPYIWFHKWRDGILRSLPPDSTLIERPKGLKKVQL